MTSRRSTAACQPGALRGVFVRLFVALFVCGFLIGTLGATGAFTVVAQENPPSTPVSYYGSVTDEGGTEPPDGTVIVAVGYDASNSSIDRDSIEVDDGTYGGSGGFDEKLRITSEADSVRFYVGDPNGTEFLEHDSDPDEGPQQFNLTAPSGTFGDVTTQQTQTATATPTATPTATEAPPTETEAPSTEDEDEDQSDENEGQSTGEDGESAKEDDQSSGEETANGTADGNGTTDGGSTTGTVTETSDPGGDGGGGLLSGLPLGLLPILLVVFGILGAVQMVGTDRVIQAGQGGLEAVVGAINGTDKTVRLVNETQNGFVCKVRCRTPQETIFLETLRVEGMDTMDVGTAPNEPVEIAIKIKGGPAERRRFGNPEEFSEIAITVSNLEVAIDAE